MMDDRIAKQSDSASLFFRQCGAVSPENIAGERCICHLAPGHAAQHTDGTAFWPDAMCEAAIQGIRCGREVGHAGPHCCEW